MGIKMNISFAEYLNEQLLNESGLSTEKITIDYLNKYCSKAIWMAQRDTPIWRGDYSIFNALSQNGGMVVVDTMKTTRKSAHTKNYYTLIFDYIFSTSMTQFPLRSKSIICSTDEVTADGHGGAIAVIPTDNAKIGFVNTDDIWDIKLSSTYNYITYGGLSSLNDAFKSAKIPEDINSIKKQFDAPHNTTDHNGLYKMFPSFDKLIDYYKNIIVKHFKPYTSANVPVSGDHELWISGDVVLIDGEFWRDHIKHGTSVTKWELK